MNSGYFRIAVGGGGSSRVAHEASVTTSSSNALRRIAWLRGRHGQPFDESPRDVRFDDDAPVGGHVADHAGDAVEAGNLLAIEFLATVEGNRNPPRVEGDARGNHLDQLIYSV